MSKWVHRGHDVVLEGASFVHTATGKRVRSSSLAAATKAIDKYLDTQSKTVPISLPVVFLQTVDWNQSQAGEVGTVTRGVITGISDENRIMGLPSNRKFTMPDSEENAALISTYILAEAAFDAAKNTVEDRVIASYFNSKASHAETVAKLQASYDAALKAESNA